MWICFGFELKHTRCSQDHSQITLDNTIIGFCTISWSSWSCSARHSEIHVHSQL